MKYFNYWPAVIVSRRYETPLGVHRLAGPRHAVVLLKLHEMDRVKSTAAVNCCNSYCRIASLSPYIKYQFIENSFCVLFVYNDICMHTVEIQTLNFANLVSEMNNRGIGKPDIWISKCLPVVSFYLIVVAGERFKIYSVYVLDDLYSIVVL